MTYQQVLENARTCIGPYCKACNDCNGKVCRNTMPGPGAKGEGTGFIRNAEKWREICVNMDTICPNEPVDTAVELFAALCKQYGLDPLADGVIIGHAEGHRRGVASNHADPELLWRTYDMGYTMNGFRRDVAEAMKNGAREEALDMPRYDSVAEMPQWARAGVQRLIDRGALQGNTDGKLDVSEDMIRTMIVCQRMLDEQKET